MQGISVNRSLKWIALIVSAVVALGSIAFLISGYSLVAASDRGILSDASGVAPSAEMVADLAWPRIVLGGVGLLVAIAALLLVWVRNRGMALLAALIGVSMVVALIVSEVLWSLTSYNVIVLVLMVVGLIVLAGLLASRFAQSARSTGATARERK